MLSNGKDHPVFKDQWCVYAKGYERCPAQLLSIVLKVPTRQALNCLHLYCPNLEHITFGIEVAPYGRPNDALYVFRNSFNINSLQISLTPRSKDVFINQILPKFLPRLTKLAIQNGNLTNTDLHKILTLKPDLVHLDLEWNKISGKGLEEIFRICKYLTYLNIGGNQINEEALKYLTSVQSPLSTLKLDRISIENMDNFQYINRLQHLTTLHLAFSSVSEKMVQRLNPGLIELNLSWNHMKNCCQWISQLSKLQRLYLEYSDIDDNGLLIICEKMPQLTLLDITQGRITATGAQKMHMLPLLKSLSIQKCQLGYEGIRNITKLKSLETLNISSCELKEGAGVLLSRIKTLRSVKLEWNYFGSVTVERLQRNNRRLRDIGIRNERILKRVQRMKGIREVKG